jgi:hypothetical protein
MKFGIELYGERQDRLFDSPTKAAEWAVETWPDVPQVIQADDPENDTLGWLLVAVPDDLGR